MTSSISDVLRIWGTWYEQMGEIKKSGSYSEAVWGVLLNAALSSGNVQKLVVNYSTAPWSVVYSPAE